MSTHRKRRHFSSSRRHVLRRFGQLGVGMSALGAAATA
ncbi:Uncharacterised protein [Oligella urethralis]|nr:Uncharacterised protein [Oligella urethralis]